MNRDSIQLISGINEEMENRLIAECSPFIDALHKSDPNRYSIVANNQLTGLISADKDGYFHIALQKEFRHLGLAGDSVIQFMKRHPKEAYFWDCDTRNIPSANLVRNLGGKFIGYYEQNLCFRLNVAEVLYNR